MSRVYITTDLDWASEDVIHEALGTFSALRIPLTIFQTHLSNEVLSYAKSHPCELEWHPNFLLGSSHGETAEEIITSLSTIPAERKVVRCHLYHCPKDRFGEFMGRTGIRAASNDLSLLSLKPIRKEGGILEIPLFFEDGCFIKAGYPFDICFIEEKMKAEGDYIFLFHPIHIAFNSFDYGLTRSLKDGLSREEYNHIPKQTIDEKRNQGYGIANLLVDLVNSLKKNGHSFHLMKEAIR